MKRPLAYPPEETRKPSQGQPRPRRGGKTRASRTAVSKSEALRVLSLHEDTHHEVLVAFRRAGGSFDRWAATDQQRLAEAITAAEDRLEMRCDTERRRALRQRLRDLRRRLESAA